MKTALFALLGKIPSWNLGRVPQSGSFQASQDGFQCHPYGIIRDLVRIGGSSLKGWSNQGDRRGVGVT